MSIEGLFRLRSASAFDDEDGDLEPGEPTRVDTLIGQRFGGAQSGGGVTFDSANVPIASLEDEVVALDYASLEPDAEFPYELRGQVGAGAMGVVYRAWEPLLTRDVAVKVIRTEFLDGLSIGQEQHAVQRFLQEARSAARLNHPGVATIYRIGKTRTGAYIAMEWLDGQTLEQRLDDGPPPTLEETVQLGLRLLATLSAAHRLGIVHRDVKPGNLFITREGRLKVTDFGIARVCGSDLVQTQTGVFLGTPIYASPEQIKGAHVDARSDLFSVGVILYEMLCGRLPHVGDNIFTLSHAVLDEDAVPLRVHNPQVSAALEAVVMRALQKSPMARFSDAAAMSAALRAAVRDLLPGAPNSWASLSMAPVSRSASSLDLKRTTLTPVQLGQAAGSAVVHGATPAAMVAQLIIGWPARQLGVRAWSPVLDRALVEPPHGESFSGAIRVGYTLLLVWNGLLMAVLDAVSGESGDAVLEGLSERARLTLYSCPDGFGERARIVKHLAALVVGTEVERANLSSRVHGLGRLADRLEADGFDGVLRLRHAAARAFVLFSHGQVQLELASRDWPEALRDGGWRRPGDLEIIASVETLTTNLPMRTWRDVLADVAFDVAPPTGHGKPRAVTMREDDGHDADDNAWRNRLRNVHTHDPVEPLQRWILDVLPLQLRASGAARGWRPLARSLSRVRRVLWHHGLPRPASAHRDAFALVTFDQKRRALHVVDCIEHGTLQSLHAFVERVRVARAARTSGRELIGAMLIAQTFDPDALVAYRKLAAPTWLGRWRDAGARRVHDRTAGGFWLVLGRADGRGSWSVVRSS